MKAVYVGGECEFCRDFPDNDPSEPELVAGRAYEIVHQEKMTSPNKGIHGVGYRVAGVSLPAHWYHCSCSFREIDGDPDAWRETFQKGKLRDPVPA